MIEKDTRKRSSFEPNIAFSHNQRFLNIFVALLRAKIALNFSFEFLHWFGCEPNCEKCQRMPTVSCWKEGNQCFSPSFWRFCHQLTFNGPRNSLFLAPAVSWLHDILLCPVLLIMDFQESLFLELHNRYPDKQHFLGSSKVFSLRQSLILLNYWTLIIHCVHLHCQGLWMKSTSGKGLNRPLTFTILIFSSPSKVFSTNEIHSTQGIKHDKGSTPQKAGNQTHVLWHELFVHTLEGWLCNRPLQCCKAANLESQMGIDGLKCALGENKSADDEKPSWYSFQACGPTRTFWDRKCIDWDQKGSKTLKDEKCQGMPKATLTCILTHLAESLIAEICSVCTYIATKFWFVCAKYAFFVDQNGCQSRYFDLHFDPLRCTPQNWNLRNIVLVVC